MATTELPAALVITRNLPPLVGGMERLVWHIVDELRDGYRVHVIGPRGCARHLPGGVTATEVPIRPMPLYLLRTKLAALGQSLRIRPALVFAGSGLTAPFAWLAARLSGARCIVYLHGLDVEARHPVYRLLWHPFLRRCDRVLVNSRFTRDLAMQAGIDQNRIAVLHPGVELPDMQQTARQRAAFRAHHALGDAPLMLYVGRITARKGLSRFVEHILPDIIRAVPGAKLVVIGDEPHQAVLNSGSELQRTHQALASSGLSEHVHFLGSLAHDDPEITAAYFAADVHVFPVQDRPGDNEGFGMVAIEAAAHGLPTVAFAVGGVADAIKNRRSGHLVAAGDATAFIQCVNGLLAATSDAKDEWATNAQSFATEFTWGKFGKTLLDLCARPRIQQR